MKNNSSENSFTRPKPYDNNEMRIFMLHFFVPLCLGGLILDQEHTK